MASDNTLTRLNAEGRFNRGALEITADILRAALHGARKTHLMYRANLSYDLLRKYVTRLTASGLLATDENHCIYCTTDQGCQFLAVFEEMEKHGTIFYEKRTALSRLVQVVQPESRITS